jgi:hypothetical protein
LVKTITMKKLLLLITLGMTFASSAQTSYYTGFDNAPQTAGWQQFRKGYLSPSQWTLPSFGAFSPPAMLHHDYPVGSAGTDTTVDWYVSPAFNFSAGGSIDSLKVLIYSITGSGTPVDYLGLVLLQGSNDPTLATQTQLANLSGMVSSANIWEDTGSFTVPVTAGLCYIGIKYRATNNWFVANIDNLHITSNATGITENTHPSLRVYPNPATNKLNITFTGQQHFNVCCINASGQILLVSEVKNSSQVDVSALPAGMYTLIISDKSSVSYIRFAKK